MNKVYNKRTDKIPEGSVYVGRPSSFGNPFVVGVDGDRDTVVAKYEQWIKSNEYLLAYAKLKLKGKDLICWCAPESCHADVLLKIVNE